MDLIKGKGKRGQLILKTWEGCRSFGRKNRSRSGSSAANKLRSKSWPAPLDAAADDDDNKKRANSKKKNARVAPEGCFSVYVGAQKQRFVIRTEFLNHPLFKMLLEEAESEYGFSSEGPLELPCQLQLFTEVLAEMESDIEIQPRCRRFSKFTYTSYHLLPSPARLLA